MERRRAVHVEKGKAVFLWAGGQGAQDEKSCASVQTGAATKPALCPHLYQEGAGRVRMERDGAEGRNAHAVRETPVR